MVCLCWHGDTTPWGSCLWRALDVTFKPPRHTWPLVMKTYTRNTHMYAHPGACIEWLKPMQTHKQTKSRWQIKEETCRDEPFRAFENLPNDVSLKNNYPRGYPRCCFQFTSGLPRSQCFGFISFWGFFNATITNTEEISSKIYFYFIVFQLN